MKAIILAGGIGTRLSKYTKNQPKCMLEFNGKALIEWQVEILRACGINKIVIVRAYMPEKIQILNVKYYTENKGFTKTNMVETLFTAEEEMNDEVLVCYSDILYEKRIIEKILFSKVDIGVTVDKDYWEYWKARLNNPKADVESLVIDEEGKIIELGDTNCTTDKARFRYVGLIKFSKRGVQALKKIYHENRKKYFDNNKPWISLKTFKEAHMTCILQALINEGYMVKPIIIKRGWLEFDTAEDYENYNIWLREKTLTRFFSFE